MAIALTLNPVPVNASNTYILRRGDFIDAVYDGPTSGIEISTDNGTHGIVSISSRVGSGVYANWNGFGTTGITPDGNDASTYAFPWEPNSGPGSGLPGNYIDTYGTISSSCPFGVYGLNLHARRDDNSDTADGFIRFAIQPTNGDGDLVLVSADPGGDTTKLPDAPKFENYSTTLTISGGTAPYTVNVYAPGLNSGNAVGAQAANFNILGTALNSNADITVPAQTFNLVGTPTATGAVTFRLHVTDSGGFVGFKDFTAGITIGVQVSFVAITPNGGGTITTRSDATLVNSVNMYAITTSSNSDKTITWTLQGGGTLTGSINVPYTVTGGLDSTQMSGFLIDPGQSNGLSCVIRAAMTANPSIYQEVTITNNNSFNFATAINPNNMRLNSSHLSQVVTATDPSGSGGYWRLFFKDPNDGVSPNNLITYTPFSGTSTTITANTINSGNSFAVKFFPYASNLDLSTSFENYVDTSAGSGIVINTGPLNDGTVGTPYIPVTFSYTGTAIGAVNWVIAPGAGFILPPGMTLNSGTGVLSGTPTSNGVFDFNVTVQDIGPPFYSNTKAYRLTVNNVIGGTDPIITSVVPQHISTNGQAGIIINGQNFTSGDTIRFDSASESYNITATTTSFTSTAITITTGAWNGTPGAADTNLIRGGVIKTTLGAFTPNGAIFGGGSSLTITGYNPTSQPAGSGNFTLNVNGTGFAPLATIFFDGVSKTTTYSGGNLSCTILNADYISPRGYSIYVRNPDGGTSNTVTFTSTGVTLTATPSTLSNGTRGLAYSQALTGHGGTPPYTFSLISGQLPDGITLSSAGLLSGTVQPSANTQSFTIRMTDNVGVFVSLPYTLSIVGGVLQITTPTDLPNCRQASSYTQVLAASGGTPPYTWSGTLSSGSLPTGLTFSAGTISGTPSNPSDVGQTFHPGFTVTDSAGSPVTANKTFNLAVLAALSSPSIITISPPQGPIAGQTLVTISGTNLISGATVLFGTSPAPNVVVTNAGTTLTCTSPAAAVAGPVNVTVTNPDGGTVVQPSGFNYINIVTPIVSSVDKPDGPFAGGRTIVISGSSFLAVTSVKLTPPGGTGALCTGISINIGGTEISCVTPAFVQGVQTIRVDVNVEVTNSAGTGTLVNGYTYRPAPKVEAITPSQSSTAGGATAFITGQNFFSRGGVKPRVFIGGIEIDPSNITLVGGS